MATLYYKYIATPTAQRDWHVVNIIRWVISRKLPYFAIFSCNKATFLFPKYQRICGCHGMNNFSPFLSCFRLVFRRFTCSELIFPDGNGTNTRTKDCCCLVFFNPDFFLHFRRERPFFCLRDKTSVSWIVLKSGNLQRVYVFL